MNLNVFIAKSGFCSRRKADSFIKNGKVKINGIVINKPWTEVKNSDSVKIAGKTLQREENVYIAFNKPTGVTCTLKDRFAREKIIDFIPKKFGRVYPVGRLDKNSRGLLLLVNDGELCYRLTHPKFEIEKEYAVRVKGKVTTSVLRQFKEGIKDGEDILKIKEGRIEESQLEETKLRIIVSEGKKRHLRRLFKQAGFPVLDVKRIRIGNLRLGSLKEGEFRVIKKESIYKETGVYVNNKKSN